jgi:putative ABC transport system permease protein
MKFLKFIVRNALRNRRRAVLTVLSIGIAIITISVLRTIVYAFNAGVESADDSRLVVRRETAIIYQLPLAYRARIVNVPGVKAVTWANWFGGIYRDKKEFFGKFAIDAETYLPMFPEIGIDPAQVENFKKDRTGCIIGKKLAEKYGFKVGDVIPIIGDIYPSEDEWRFNVQGIYHATRPGFDETGMYFNWKYLDEYLPKRRQGEAGWYMVQLANPSDAPRVSKAIDALFENSPHRTLTQTEKAFQMEFVMMMGNVGFLVTMIGSAVVFATFLVSANTMAMAARERTTEIAILKTLGFKSPLLGTLVLAEGMGLTLMGWALGSVIAFFICKGVATALSTYFPVFEFKWQTALLSLGIAGVTGLVSSLFPAAHAARTTIVGAMREVA